jgi:2-haloacid dehalogenase
MAGARWATFDCYGTLIDWNGGILRELERLFGVSAAPGLLDRYHELEREVQAEEYRSYRQVLSLTLERLAADAGVQIPEGEAGALGGSLPDWEPFPEVHDALHEARERGWLLAILSNSDRDLIAASQAQIDVPFDLAIVAEDTGSYKPAHGHWERFFEQFDAEHERHVHVGASVFHDLEPAAELGLKAVWINRLHEKSEAPRAAELKDLSRLPEVLESLVPEPSDS